MTARDGLADKITGLGLGADDYIVKPFEPLELISRIEAVLRRTGTSHAVQYEHNGVVVKLNEHVVLKDGVPVNLTAREFSLLAVLIKNKNIALSRERLLELAWGYDYMGETRTVDTHILNLRKKLGLADVIRTVPKLGYRWEDV